jgi:hypothetical protein
MYVIVTGNAFDGIRLWGPFETVEDANDWADEIQDENYVVAIKEPV